MKHPREYGLAAILLICCFPLVEVCEAQHRTKQKVFTDWGGISHELVIDIFEERLRIRKPKVSYGPTSYLVDGMRYHLDENMIEANYKNHEIRQALTIKDESLFYEGAPVTLPPKVKMRNLWQAVLWEGWVICLGRTSKTDASAQLKPPFFATELITFRVRQRVAKVMYINFNPPSGTRLFILDPK